MKTISIIATMALILAGSVLSANADFVTIDPIADAYVSELNQNTTYNTNDLQVSNSTNTPDADRWVFLKYDLSSIPDNADVSKAYINWYIYGVTYDASAPEHDVFFNHVIDDGWNETSITWNNKPAYDDYLGMIYSPGLSPSWKKGYIDYDDAGFDYWNESIDLADNYLSIVMQCTDDAYYRAIVGYSQNLSAGPQLCIEYTAPVPIPSTISLLGLGILGLARISRKKQK